MVTNASPPATSRWWNARFGRARREPRLAGAILDRRTVRYALYRLRGFAAARGTAAALHVLEAAVLLRALPVRVAIIAFLLGHATMLVAGAWWGATEAQRIEVRERRDDADRITARWLWWAFALAATALVVAASVAVRLHARPLSAAYALVLGVRIATDLPLRVWHGRISARRRLRRWLSWQLVAEATGPLLALALQHRLASWSLFVALAGSTLVSRAITWTVIRRAYRDARIPWIRAARGPLPWRRAFGWGAAGVATRLPSLLGVMFLAAPGLPETAAIGLHMTVGALAAATGWVWSHYQDFIGLADPIYARIRRRLAWMVAGETLVIGILVGIASLVIVLGFAPRSLPIEEEGVAILIPPAFADPRPYAYALPAIALGLSAISAGQLLAWVRGRAGAVVISGTCAVLVAVVARAVLEPAASGGELAPSVIRFEHAVVGIGLAACGVVLAWLAVRGVGASGRSIPWERARRRAELEPDAQLLATTASRGGVAFEDALTRLGARWWARRGQRWIVGGLTTAATDALVLACAGAVERIEAVPPRVASEAAAAPLRFRFDGRGPRHPELDDLALSQVWAAIERRLRGAGRGGPIAISDVEIDGDGESLVAVSARFRGPG